MITSTACFNTLWIYTALKPRWIRPVKLYVSIPSEFTLLSNAISNELLLIAVSIPSEFTLLSNNPCKAHGNGLFQYPLNLHCSQTSSSTIRASLLFQYPLNLHCSQTFKSKREVFLCFNTLWIYTALKLWLRLKVLSTVSIPSEFTLLSNCLILDMKPKEFQYPLNLHCSQTIELLSRNTTLFQYPLNLHCSQTILVASFTSICFNTLWIYTALKPTLGYEMMFSGFNTLWIYTALKHVRWYA